MAPTGAGHTWTTGYGAVGINGFGDVQKWTDGMNEKGLYVGLQYHPGTCEYSSPDGVEPDQLMSAVDLTTMLLGTCATVADVRAALAGITAWPWVFPPMQAAPPAHFIVHDATGTSIVVEWLKGEMRIFDNPIGVATNSPSFDWHLTNAANYLHLSSENPEPIDADGVTFAPFGAGFGMIGLPGDGSPASRFVRAATYVMTLPQPTSAPDAELAAMHLLNNFDIPAGICVASTAPVVYDTTLWSVIANLRDLTYSIRMIDDPTFRTVALGDLNFAATKPATYPLPAPAGFPALHLA